MDYNQNACGIDKAAPKNNWQTSASIVCPCSLLMSSGLLTSEEVHAVCVDAVFALFICPAIVDPNALGVIDTPLITYMARSNLMQVAQILQVYILSIVCHLYITVLST